MYGIGFAYIAMMAIITASNYLVQFPINDWLTWGALPYPMSFLVTELSNRFYGPKAARKVVYVGFFLGVLFSFSLAIPKIALASGSAFLVAQLLDIAVFNKLRQRVWWYAPFLASLIASFVDTVIFWSIAFWGEPVPVVSWAFGDFCVKLTMDVIMLIPFRFILYRTFALNQKSL